MHSPSTVSLSQPLLTGLLVPLLLGFVACGSLSYYPQDPGDLKGKAGDDDDDAALDCERDCGNPDCAYFCDADGDGEIQIALGGEDCDDDDPDIYPGADERCDGVDSDCDEIDCHFSDDFETGSLDFPWNSDGGVPWYVFDAVAKDGRWSATSGDITHDEQSRMRIELDFPDGGTISFWHQGSTEQDYDIFHFRIDGEERGTWSGTWGWTREQYEVTPGRHTFVWVYIKDLSVNVGQDAVAVDSVVTEGGVP